MAYKSNYIDGDLNVGHNESIGGSLEVKGKTTFRGGVKIEGFLEAEFIKDWNKGFFDNPSDLFTAYPNPQPGWVAFVQVDGKYFLYRENKGSWSFTSTDVSQFIQIVGDINNYTQEVGELREEVAENQGSLSSFISQITEVKDTANKASKDVGDLGNKVSDIESSVSEQNGKIQTLENASIQAGNNLTALTKTVSDIKASNGAHEVKISDLESKIKIRYAESITGLKTITNNGKTLQVPVENGTIATTRITDGISQSLSDVEFNLNELDRHVEEQLEAINADQSNLHDLHDQEVADRKSAITSLSSEFNQSLLSEAQERMAADSSLGNRITTLSNTVAINKITTDSLIDVVNDRVTNIATPRVAIIEAGTKTIQQNSVVRNYDVVFLSTMKCFAAKTSDGYFSNWMKYSVYPSADVYGAQENEVNNGAPSPIVGRLYTKDNELYIWDGNNFIVQGKVDEKIINAIAEIIANAPEDLDTLKEVADYIESDKTKAAEIETSISNLQLKDKEHDDELQLVGNRVTTAEGKIIGLQGSVANNTNSITANTEALAKQAEELATKAPNVGYAPDLKVDFAKELAGRGVAEPQEIGTIRPTGLISIGDGNATIEKIKGKSLVWNQVVNASKVVAQYEKNLYAITLSNGLIEVSKSGGATTVDSLFVYFPHNFIASRKYLIVYNLKRFDGENKDTTIRSSGIFDGVKYHDLIRVSGADYRFFSPTESFTSLHMQINQPVTTGVALSYTLRPVIYDLTKMFGVGNEPTTIEEFEARKPLGVSDEYNEGEIISYDAKELKSVGFNAWDEEWEVGGLANGEPSNTTSQIRSQNFIPCAGGQDYYGYMGWSAENYLHLSLYDSDKVHIGNVGVNRKVVTLPANASYFKVFTTHECGYGNVYKGDICINLSHSGYRNGEYVPYEEGTLRLPDVKSIKDKDGNQLFPYGLLSAGNAHDEITATKAVKRIGVVDMGTLNWIMSSSTGSDTPYQYFHASLLYKKPKVYETENSLTAHYICVPSLALNIRELVNGTYMLFYGNSRIYLRDTSYTDVTTFKQAMSGVLLYYELEEPIEVDLPEPLNLTYDAWDFGTEELIAEGATTPLNADIVYQFNAVDRIRENTAKNKKLEEELAELKAQLTQLTQVTNDEDSNA